MYNLNELYEIYILNKTTEAPFLTRIYKKTTDFELKSFKFWIFSQ